MPFPKRHWLVRLDIQTHLSFLPFQRIRNNLKRFLCYKCLLKKYRFSVDGGRDDNVKYLYGKSFSGEPLLCLSAQLKPPFGKRPPHAGFAAGWKKVLLVCQVVKKSSFPQAQGGELEAERRRRENIISEKRGRGGKFLSVPYFPHLVNQCNKNIHGNFRL